MKSLALPTAAGIVSLALAAILPVEAMAAKPTSGTPLRAYVFTTVPDQQSTQGYWQQQQDPEWAKKCLANSYGPLSLEPVPQAKFLPDTVIDAGTDTGIKADTAWADDATTMSPEDWIPVGSSSQKYEHGTFPSSSSAYLRAEFTSSNKILSLDTRVTAGPRRTFNINFNEPYGALPTAPALFSGTTLNTPGLFEALGQDSMLSMQVCTTTSCLEGRDIFAKFWFTDPNNSAVTWRVDWLTMRVLRVSQTTWYFIAGPCDGTRVANLTKLEGARTKPRSYNSGQFLIPLFIAVELK
jgi:hypothetical protein